MFIDRQDAAKKLTPLLKKYKNSSQAIVLGLPRGGVVTAYEIAKDLHLPLDILSLRKIGAPFNPELALGAVSATGEIFLNEDLISKLDIAKDYLQQKISDEMALAKKRYNIFRPNKEALNLKGKDAILVDDGLATGATMAAAILTAKAQQAAKVIVAIPVAAKDSLEEIKIQADDVICLYVPLFFQAVGEFYQDFSEVHDQTVIQLLSALKTTS